MFPEELMTLGQREQELKEIVRIFVDTCRNNGAKYDLEVISYLCGHGATCNQEVCQLNFMFVVSVVIRDNDVNKVKQLVHGNPKFADTLICSRTTPRVNIKKRIHQFGLDRVGDQIWGDFSLFRFRVCIFAFYGTGFGQQSLSKNA